jgi:hypothetical protein
MATSTSSSSNRGCYLAILLALIVGIVLGALIGARYRNALITVQLENNKKVFIAPREGDVIHWTSENGDLQKIQFVGSIPCKEGKDLTTTCTFDSPPLRSGAKTDKRTYSYGCVGNINPLVCQDPGIGPKSMTNFGKPVFPSPIAGPAATKDTPSPYVTCDDHGNAVLYPDPSTLTPGANVNVSKNETIEWGSDVSFTFNVQQGTCNADTPTITDTDSSCTVAQGAQSQTNIMINTTGCTGSNQVPMNLNIQ